MQSLAIISAISGDGRKKKTRDLWGEKKANQGCRFLKGRRRREEGAAKGIDGVVNK